MATRGAAPVPTTVSSPPCAVAVAIERRCDLLWYGLTCTPAGVWVGSTGMEVLAWSPPHEATMVYRGIDAMVLSMCALTDGTQRLLVGGTSPYTIRLLRLCQPMAPAGAAASAGGTATVVRLYDGHSGDVCSLCEVPDDRFASAAADGSVCLWDMESGARLAVLGPHAGDVYGVGAALVGGVAALVSGCEDGAVRVWDLRLHSHVSTSTVTRSAIWCVSRTRRGSMVTGHADGGIRLWDGTCTSVTDELRGHSDGVNTVVEMGDGRLVSVSRDKTVRWWEAGDGASGSAAWRSGGMVQLSDVPCCGMVSADGAVVVGGSDGWVMVLRFTWGRRRAAVVAWCEGADPAGGIKVGGTVDDG